MRNTHRKLSVLSTVCFMAVLLPACGGKSTPSSSQDHIRGTVQSLDGQVLTVATASGSVRVQLAQPTQVATVVQSTRDKIAPGSFLGITSVKQPNGSERAVEIHVFPEAMRGTGEGSYGWDLAGAAGSHGRMTNGTAAPSTMTNGTVSGPTMTSGTVAAQEGGASLKLVYKTERQTDHKRSPSQPAFPSWPSSRDTRQTCSPARMSLSSPTGMLTAC